MHLRYKPWPCVRPSGCLPVCMSVCPSVTSRRSTKSAKRRITQITPHASPGTLVFCQRSPRNSNGITPYGGTKCRWGGSKSATFHKYLSGKRYKIDAWYTGCAKTVQDRRMVHGLRGNASPVLTATGFVNGKWQLSTPTESTPLDRSPKICC